jgi:hypothetical protein
MGGFEATTKSRCEEQHGNMNPSIEHFRIKPTPPFFLRKNGMDQHPKHIFLRSEDEPI